MVNYKGLATSIFGGLVDSYADFFSMVKHDLPMANMKIPFRTYMSTAFFFSLIACITAVVVVVEMMFILSVPLYTGIIYLIFIPIGSAFGCFVIMLFYPHQKVNARKNNIESNLPFVLMHMASIIESGLPPHAVFRLIADFEEYGEISHEMKKIVRNMDQFGVDPLTAIRDVAQKSPSNNLKQVLLGIVTATESGGDVKLYLKNAGEQALFDWRIKRQKFLEQLSTYSEFYTGLMIAAPLFIVALLAVMNMISPEMAGFKIINIMQMATYLAIPGMNLAFLLFLKGVEVEI
jgi:flagellar protein FlaJ